MIDSSVLNESQGRRRSSATLLEENRSFTNLHTGAHREVSKRLYGMNNKPQDRSDHSHEI